MAPALVDGEALAELAALLGHRLADGTARAYQSGIALAAADLRLTAREVVRRALAFEPVAYATVVSKVTIQETYFYRTPEHFAAAAAFARDRAAAGRPISSAWSVGCATGEEAYSLAHALSPSAPKLRVVGTDVAPEALRTARNALYGPWSFRDRSPQALGFEQAPSGWRVPAPLRGAVLFHEANLARSPLQPPAELGAAPDVIFCRNVLLYFAPARAAEVLAALVNALAPGGLLVLGALEVPAVLPAGLERLAGGEGCLFTRTTGSKPKARARSARLTRAAKVAPVEPLTRVRALVAAGSLREALEAASELNGAEALELCATLCLELEEPLRARHFLRRLLALEPDHAGAHLRLLLLAVRGSDAKTAAECAAALHRVTDGLAADASIGGADVQVAYVRSVLAEVERVP